MKKLISILLLVVLFIVSLVIFVVYEAPVSKVLAKIPLPPGISILGANGTILEGQAKTLRIKNYEYHNLKWDTSILGLISKFANVSVSDPKGLTGHASLKLEENDTIVLTDLALHLTIPNFLKYTKYNLPVDIAGLIDIKLKEAKFNTQKCMKIEGTLDLDGISVMTPMGDFNFGKLILDLNCRNGLFIAKTKHSNPYFSLDGNLEYDMVTRKYSVKAVAKPNVEKGNEIKMILEMIGKSNNAGAYEINYQGVFVY